MSKSSQVLTNWPIEDDEFWQNKGKKIARQNLWISIPALFLAFALWMVWSVLVVNLPKVGFDFTTGELFWLTAVPGLAGATLRIFYSFMVPVFGGRRWTAISTASLLIPALGMGFAVQDPSTPYNIFFLLAVLCGFGGGNFASSMSNIAYFFPKKEKGNAMALNAGLGNLGVSAVQLVVPLIISVGVFSWAFGPAQTTSQGQQLWLQNGPFIWVPFIVIVSFLAWFFMHDIASAKASISEQTTIFKRKHCWIMCVLYVGTFGSFIGFSAGFPLLASSQFPAVDAIKFAFLGPLVGALSRAGSGWAADKYGGGRVTLWVFVALMVGALGVYYFLLNKHEPYAFYGFFTAFMLLFAVTGVGNASTFQMVPIIFRKERSRALKGEPDERIVKEAERESAATVGFISAMGAYGAFFVPQSYNMSIKWSGEPLLAIVWFICFYVLCIGLTWWYYTRKNAEISC